MGLFVQFSLTQPNFKNSVWKLVCTGAGGGFLEKKNASTIALIKTRAQVSAHLFSAVVKVCEAGMGLFVQFSLTHSSHLFHLDAFHTEGTKENTRLFPVS